MLRRTMLSYGWYRMPGTPWRGPRRIKNLKAGCWAGLVRTTTGLCIVLPGSRDFLIEVLAAL
jgi:hypothetical protein